MKRISLTLTIIVMTLAASAKDPKPCPSGYYNSAVNKSDQALLTALYNIISSHTNIGYDGLWDAYADTDTDPNGYYIDMYSNYDKFTYSNKCGNYSAIGDCINREHSVPKSWWGSGKQAQYSDIFNIVPTDGYVNNQRSNYPYGVCEGGTRLTNGQYVAKGRMGYSTRSGYSGRVFEPDDEYKGDFARAYFYMAACYNNVIGNWTQSGGSAFFAGNDYPVFTTYAIDLLMEWHRLDPVSEKETTRNCYAHAWQGNRNPFIDHPELAEHIWGNMQGQAWTGDGQVVTIPTLLQPASGATINVGTIPADGTSVSTQVTIMGSNLSQQLAISVSGTGFSVSPASLSATDVNNGTTVTVTYNGTEETATGTLNISSTEVSRTVTLTAGKGQSGDDPDEPIVLTGDSIIETWEGCASGGYWSSTEVQGAAFLWLFDNASIYAQSNDHYNGAIGCRFGKTSTSCITMLQDVSGTSGISFYAATYGSTEAQATMQVLYSVDKGNTWTLLNTVTPPHELTRYAFSLDVTGDVRFKFQQTAGARLNLDDIAIYAAQQEPVEPKVYFNGNVTAMTATQNGESTISEVTVVTEDNTEAVIITVDDNFELSLDQQHWSTSLTLDASGETFYVRMASTAEVGSFEGTITANAGNAVAYADVEGEVTAPAFILGDVNMDKNVDVEDVTQLIAMILGAEPEPFDHLAADLDGNQSIDVEDVTRLITIILQGEGAKMEWKALPTAGGINVVNPTGEELEVYDLDANVAATTKSTTILPLRKGIYLVSGVNRSHKVVVK